MKLRTIGRGLRLPAALLSFVAVIPYVNAPEAPAAAAAPAPQAVAAPAPAVVTAPAPQALAVPASQAVVAPAVVKAVATPATMAFARGVPGLSPQVLSMALDAMACARARGVSGKDNLLTVIDYSLPSTEPRLWVLDLERGKVLYHELVAHGAGTGEKYATRFSNTPDSRQTSLGLFLTGGTYEGGNGYSLKLKGLDRGVNDRAEERHIVMHGAWYVSEDHARRQGRLGRSWGCPALSQEIAPEVIDTIKGGSFVFSYSGSDKSWIRTASSSLNSCGAGSEDPNATVLAVR
ncbi:MAG TPA: murein L,D-transpeptidase catalytic domain family protein [Thermoanaerobaculia bacterium]